MLPIEFTDIMKPKFQHISFVMENSAGGKMTAPITMTYITKYPPLYYIRELPSSIAL